MAPPLAPTGPGVRKIFQQPAAQRKIRRHPPGVGDVAFLRGEAAHDGDGCSDGVVSFDGLHDHSGMIHHHAKGIGSRRHMDWNGDEMLDGHTAVRREFGDLVPFRAGEAIIHGDVGVGRGEALHGAE